ncbi:serine hydrolase domain-containing protein [Streptomyces sp. NPDC092952]|uniref:serine hydrolase domain-containing protein n=1 Tax=Streptomyces sp. NPDC092952 TaxID=3366018 RepID=UPI00381D9414
MNDLRALLTRTTGPGHANGAAPGAVGLVARGDRVEVAAVGTATAGGEGGEDGTGTAPVPMARDTLFRIASLTKPVTAAAALLLIEEGRIALEEPVRQWLPELAEPRVVRTPASPLDDVVPADRAITVADVLASRAGYGFAPDFSLPAVRALLDELRQGPPQPGHVPDPDTWMAALSRLPLLRQPGEAWLYNTCSDILGVLIARVAGRPLPEFLAERLFAPLGMADTGFSVPPGKLDRFTGHYAPDPDADGGLRLLDAPDGQWSTPPAFPSGAAGLVSTADDWHAFARMLLARGHAEKAGRRLLSAESVRLMTTDHLTAAQREAAAPFLEGQGWGYGGSVDVRPIEPWNVPGRYGWVGGTGTTAHLTPATGTVAVLLTQLAMTDPAPPAPMRAFWRYASGV